MHDIKEIVRNPEAFDEAMGKRGLPKQAQELIMLYGKLKAAVSLLESNLAKRNMESEKFSQISGDSKSDEKRAVVVKTAQKTKQEISNIKKATDNISLVILGKLMELPNLPTADVPAGEDEKSNGLVREYGEPANFEFKARSHDEIGELLGDMDFPRAAKVAGARFAILYGQLARLERALAQFMLDTHVRDFGYREVHIPVLVNSATLLGSGHLPKFEEDLFKTNDEKNQRYLIPTAETVLTGLHAGEILQEEQFPLRYVCWSNCFRAEAGAAGKDTRGLIRLHQFSKVELVSYTTAEKSRDEHERMTNCAEEILKKLELPYRVMLLCAGDMGFAAEKTYDLEVWMSAQKKYREISSCSNCGAFQSRRLKVRFKRKGEKGTIFPHALNGSGLAVGRTMAALLENYQQADGSVVLPEVLHKYMDGETKLSLPEISGRGQ